MCLLLSHLPTSPHKLRECLLVIIFLMNGLKYSLTGNEVKRRFACSLLRLMARSKLIKSTLLVLLMSSVLTRPERILSDLWHQWSLCCSPYYTWWGQVQVVQSDKNLCGHKRNPSPGNLWCSHHLLPWFPHKGEWQHSDWFGTGKITDWTLVTCVWWPEVLTWEELA